MMKKIDQEGSVEDEVGVKESPLLSQNISIVETGNYSHIFEKFIDFIGVKSLIITDIDSAMTMEKMKELKEAQTDENLRKKIKQKVKISDSNAAITTNASLKFFYDTENLTDFKDKAVTDMVLKRDISTKKWIKDKDGLLLCAYQSTEENSDKIKYHATSFEDSFLNRQFIVDNKESFKSLKHIDHFEDKSKDSYDLSEKCIDKKPSFAIEILLNSTRDEITGKYFSNWEIPEYIKQGLLWLKKD